ncbi:tRNA (guanosine(37)-N1)-methyltransferase TrmD [Candidatus Nanogingivalis gingivitcus]|jgi:tRNA (guanine-N(1)-)-methyltransferase|uniref:tRNA (guanine-N(1)-)-methyltransferase n=1 Tax=Candidatus Nanogingivalis gingivitcus TaxID=2171992 RepID=A0ABY0FJ28_9BACT|nr:tRNA (guanosine(37)-N1)-methyltransferase TrmD [Candidatus Nanogingivalis gingivitcus]RYC72945.1 tRNA (guanine-N(1)-)-methyltransferase [Candidatus Nanogingivalis gingivitcus]
MKIQVITLFPEMFEQVLNSSMMWKAQNNNAVTFSVINLRNFGIGPRKQVDDTPYGGGNGMLLKPEPFFEAIKFAKEKSPNALVIAMTPSKTVLTQKIAENFANEQKDLIIICGHYEGFDERIFTLVDQKISIGQFVLTGGELPAMVLIDTVVRLLPNVLGGEDSALIESYSDGDNIEFPQYTRPAEYQGLKVPEVLLSGHHANIDKWRKENYR